MSTVRELRGITPTFQAVLNKQIGKIMDAIGEGELGTAYEDLQTLVDALRPADRDILLKNDIAHIEKEIATMRRKKGVDLYTSRQLQKDGEYIVLRRQVRKLFRAVMELLHKGNYLEIRGPAVPEGLEKGLGS